MKRILAIAVGSIGILLLAFIVFLLFVQNRRQVVGIFDPQGTFSGQSGIGYELHYISWNKNNDTLLTTLQEDIRRQRIPILTIEPWPLSEDKDRNLLSSIGDGVYDSVIDNICNSLSSLDHPITIRWGHEMEIANGRYPWSGQDPELYRNAYRHFVARCRKADIHHRVSFMWSPSGEARAEIYWPGSDVVDLIGVSVFSFDLWDEKYLGSKRSFQEIFYPKYMRLKKYNKPIIIAELGVTGTETYKNQWLKDAVFKAKFYKNLIGYVYFNSSDVEGAWDRFLPVPDWTIKRLP